MSIKREQKPPIKKATIRRRLSVAADDPALVRIKRWMSGTQAVEGFVVGLSKQWLLLARISDGVELDGWITLRLGDIQAVTRYPTEDCFEIKALRARQQWPPASPAQMALETLDELLRTAAANDRMVSVFREFERPGACSIGTLWGSDAVMVELLTVDTDGGWARKTKRFDPEDITRVDFGGRYEQALALVAGEVPRPRPH